MRSTRELAWAAGLFEGEGTITRQSQRHSSKRYQYPQLTLAMTDEDTVRRFHAAVGVGSVSQPPSLRGRSGRKPMWRWMCSGWKGSQAVIAMLWFGLGERRRAKARERLMAFHVAHA